MSLDVDSALKRARINLRDACVLCVDDNLQGLDILAQILMGFGVQRIARATTADEFYKTLEGGAVDLVLINANVGGGSGFELVRWLRRSKLEPNRFAPSIVLSGHTVHSQVTLARDCGANFVLSKPISATVLLERILWIGRSKRLFIEADSYMGPDRRFKNQGVPGDGPGRRKSDLNDELGAAVDPNLSQYDIDSLLRPQKVTV